MIPLQWPVSSCIPFWFAARASISLHLSTNTNINRSLYRNININISMSLIARGSIDIYRYRSIYQPKLLQCWRHQEVATLRLTKHTTVVPNEQCQQLGKSLEKMCILKIPIDYDNDNPNLLFFFLRYPKRPLSTNHAGLHHHVWCWNPVWFLIPPHS